MADLDPALVKAQVVDIQDRRNAPPQRVALDANVLYFVFYPSFGQLKSVGARVPHGYQTGEYQKWFGRVKSAKGEFFVSDVTLWELIQLVETAELETLFRTDPHAPPDAEFSRKDARYSYSGQLVTVRQTAIDVAQQILKNASLLPAFANQLDGLQRATQTWRSSFADACDAVLVANAKYASIPHILTDDADLATIDGMTVYTANKRLIEAARTAGKLIRLT
jgi:predicted nucleic acid-binding protein